MAGQGRAPKGLRPTGLRVSRRCVRPARRAEKPRESAEELRSFVAFHAQRREVRLSAGDFNAPVGQWRVMVDVERRNGFPVGNDLDDAFHGAR